MKNNLRNRTLSFLVCFGIVAGPLPLPAHDDAKDAGHVKEKPARTEQQKPATSASKVLEGPNQGRLLDKTRAEFLVRPDRHLVITFLDPSHQPLRVEGADISATGGDRRKPTQFTFAPSGDHYLSRQPLPEGNQVPIILHIRLRPDEKRQTERFIIDLDPCPTCNHAEYACACDHGSEAPGHPQH